MDLKYNFWTRLWHWLWYGIPDSNKLLGTETPVCPPHLWDQWTQSAYSLQSNGGACRQRLCKTCGEIEVKRIKIL